MVSTLVPLLLLGIIVVAVMYYLKTRGVILKKYPPFSIQYSASEMENGGDRPPYMSQQSYNSKFFVMLFIHTKIQ